MFLYHISNSLFSKIEPRCAFDLHKPSGNMCAVYATNNIKYCLPFGLLKNSFYGEYHWENKDGGAAIIYDGEFVLNDVAYIYGMSDDGFIQISKNQYVSKEPIQYIYYFKINPSKYILTISFKHNIVKINLDYNKFENEYGHLIETLNIKTNILKKIKVDVKLINLFNKYLNETMETFKTYCLESYKHDIKHSVNTMFNSIILINELNIKNNVEEILFAACYHDVGRSLNFNSIKHGELSWILIKRFLSEKELNDDFIKHLIINHNNKYLAQKDIYLSTIYDADILDLTRFKNKKIDKSNFINKNSVKKLEKLLYETN